MSINANKLSAKLYKPNLLCYKFCDICKTHLQFLHIMQTEQRRAQYEDTRKLADGDSQFLYRAK